MKVAVYCDTFRHSKRFERVFADQRGHDLYYVVAPLPGESLRGFAMRQLMHAAYAVLVDRHVGLFRLAARRRLVVCREPIHAAASVAIVRRLSPDIALHSMGVI